MRINCNVKWPLKVIEIKVILFGKNRYFHWRQHIGAIVTDLDTGRRFDLDYVDQDYMIYYRGRTPLTAYIQNPKNTSYIESVIVKADKNFDQFYNAYKKSFPLGGYNVFTANCADAVLFALENTCPRTFCEKLFLNIYRFLCTGFCIGLLGLKYIPAPIFSTPHDVFQRAKEIHHHQQTARNPNIHVVRVPAFAN